MSAGLKWACLVLQNIVTLAAKKCSPEMAILLVSSDSSINSIVMPKERPPIRTQGHSAQMPITGSFCDHVVSAEAALIRLICKGWGWGHKMSLGIRICLLNVCFAALAPYSRLHARNEMVLSYKPCCLHKGPSRSSRACAHFRVCTCKPPGFCFTCS